MLLRRHVILFSISLFCLIAGAFNYLLFNPHIILFDWLKVSFDTIYISNHLLRLFIKGYLSDLLWCSSLCLTTFNLFDLKLISRHGKLFLLSLPIVFELLQYPKIVNGVFDWNDVALYTIVIALFNIIFSNSKNMKYEKG